MGLDYPGQLPLSGACPEEMPDISSCCSGSVAMGILPAIYGGLSWFSLDFNGIYGVWFRGIWLVFIRFYLDLMTFSLMSCMTNWMAGLPAIRREMFWYGEKNGNVEILPLTIWLVEADDGRNQRRPTRDPERDSNHRRKSRRESIVFWKRSGSWSAFWPAILGPGRDAGEYRQISGCTAVGHVDISAWTTIGHEVNVAEKIWRRKYQKLHHSGVSPLEVKKTQTRRHFQSAFGRWDVRKATFNIQNDHQKYNSIGYLRFKRYAFIWFYLMPEVCGGEEFSSNYVRLMT